MAGDGFRIGSAFIDVAAKVNERALDGVVSTITGRIGEAFQGELDNIQNFGHSTGTKFALGAQVGFAGLGASMAGEVDTGLREVNTLFGTTGSAGEQSLGQITDAARDLSLELGISQRDIIPGMYQAISAGVPRENIFDFMSVAARAGVAGVTDTETAIDGLTTIINAFGLDTEDAAAVADSMFATVQGGKTTFEELSSSMFNVAPIAAAAGIQFGEVNASIATLTAAGVPTSVATTQIRAAIQGLLRPSEEMTAVMQEAGYASAQAAIDELGFAGALGIVYDAADGDQGVLQGLLGSVEAVGAANVIAGTGAEKFGEEMDRQANSVGAADNAFREMDQGSGRAMEQLKVTWENLAITVGEALIPTLKMLGGFLESVLGWFNSMPQPVQQALAALVFGLTALGPPLLMAYKYWKLFSLLKGFTQAATAARSLGQLGTAAKAAAMGTREVTLAMRAKAAANWLMHPIQSLKQLATAAIAGAKALVTKLASAVASAARSMLTLAANAARAAAAAVASIARQVAAWVMLGVQSMLHAAKVAAAWLIALGPVGLIVAAVVAAVALIIANWDTVKEFLLGLWESIKGAASAAWNWITQFFRDHWEIILGIFTGGIGLIVALIINNWDTIKNTAIAVWNAIVGFFQTIWDGIVAAWTAVWNGIKVGLEAVWNAITAAARFIFDAIIAYYSFLWDVITTIWTTVWNAIKTAIEVVWNAISAVGMAIFNGLVTFFTTLWDVVSSAWSTVWNAIKGAVEAVWNGIKQVAETVFNALKAFFQAWLDIHKAIFEAVWNAIKTVLTTIWNTIKDVATTVFNAIKDFFTAWLDNVKKGFEIIWNAIKSFVETIWKNIKQIAETIWNALKEFFERWLDGMKRIIETVWNAIKSFLENVWKGIKLIGETVWNALKDFFARWLDGMKNIIETVWNAIKSFLETTWNAIKSIGTTVFNAIKDTLTTIFNTIKSTIETIWNTIKSVLETIWNTIKNVATTVFNALKDAVIGVFNNMKDGLILIGNTIKDLIVGAFNAMKDLVIGVWNTLKSTASTVFNQIKDVIMGPINTVKDLATGAFNNIVDAVRGMPGRIASAARGMFDGIKNAFKEAINGLIRMWNNFEIRFAGYDIPGPGPNIPGFTISTPNIPLLAKGGHITSSGSAIVGEEGPELLSLPRGASVTPLGGAGNTYIIENVVIPAKDLREMQDVADFFSKIRQEARTKPQGRGSWRA